MLTYGFRWSAALAIALAASFVLTGIARAAPIPVATGFESPLFGLAVAPGDRLLVADAGAGPTEVRIGDGSTSLVASLPGVTDVAPIGRGEMLALTSGEEGMEDAVRALHRVSHGRTELIADLGAFEEAVDPAGDGPDSNPFDLALLKGHRTLVSDAAGNSILIVDEHGDVDWVASLPQHTVPTQPVKDVVGCPDGPPDICDLPETFDADPVATTVAIGPDGYIYAGELTGFPATPGTSRVWRIDPDARHAKCGTDPACTVVDTGPFTSIIDIQFGPDGTAYVVELDEASWLIGVEAGMPLGGTVNACRPDGTTWTCSEFATGLTQPTAVAIDDSDVYATLSSLIPGQAQVARLPGS